MKKNIYNIIKCISVSLLSLVASCDMLPDEQLYDYGGADVDAPVASEQLPITGEINGYGYVDLGLPSGIKWAVCNVAAEYPWVYGGYYAWGETEEKENYSWSTYKWCNGSGTTLTKYCNDGNLGTVDDKMVLDLEDDAACFHWGGDWRMPTNAEFKELRDNCKWIWTTMNGVNGYKVTGPNGNSIFFPAGGNRYDASDSRRDIFGYYWSSSLYGEQCSNAHYLYFHDSTYDKSLGYRCEGRTVRPVWGERLVAEYTVSVASAGNGGVAIKDKEGTSAEIETGSTITVVATPDDGYAFDGWYVDGDETPVSTAAEYTFTVSEDVAFTARFEKAEINGHEYVDLGLPSGLKWATCNVGATKPEGYGGYYAWGETEEKENYSWSTYKWCNGSEYTMTKYCTDSNYGTVDNKTVLDLEDDVAHLKWGGSWRMPTAEELLELIDNCAWMWTTLNGVNGCRLTSKINGNTIFFPAAGDFYLGTEIYNVGLHGGYWTSTIRDDLNSSAYGLIFANTAFIKRDYSRFDGHCVRAVYDELAAIVEKYTVTVNSAGNGSVAIKDKDGTSAEFEAGSTVTVVATPDEGYLFDGWFVEGNEEPVSTDAEYTFTVSEDIALVARFEQVQQEISSYEAVDLGLSVKWAAHNVGATKPWEYGGYYAWGETEEKKNYEWNTYKLCNGRYDTMIKYCTSSSYGTVDNKTTLDPEDDVAHVKWGGDWRMPTKAEQDELRNNCTWTWTIQNGVNGYKVTSKTNGNSIFLPAAGSRCGTSLNGSGSGGDYWSSSLSESSNEDAYHLYSDSGGYDWYYGNRYDGRSVRPVSE